MSPGGSAPAAAAAAWGCLGLPALRACAQGACTVPAAELNTFDSIYYLKIMQLGRVLAIFYA